MRRVAVLAGAIVVMHADTQVAINDIYATLGIGRTTLYRYVNARQGEPHSTRR